MGTDQPVRVKVPYFPTSVVSIGFLWLVGLVAVALHGPHPHHGEPHEWFPRHWYPMTLLFLFGLLMLTACIALLSSRHAVRAVEFTREQLRFESRAGVCTVRIADVRAVWVAHSGDTERGYDRTSLRLDWRHGSGRTGRRIHCHHDPALGQALVRLLPSHVEVGEQWHELDEPDPS